MTNPQFFSQLKLHKSHARFIAHNLDLKLSEALSFIAHIHECETWQELKEKYGKQRGISNNIIPVSDVDSSEIALFWSLVDKYEKELKESYNPKIHLSCNILTLLINKKMNSVEEYQIAKTLMEFDRENGTSKDFINTIMYTDNTAYKVIKSQKNGWQVDTATNEIRNLWLSSDTFKQQFYAYYYFNNKQVHIQVREWDSLSDVSTSYVSIVNKRWFVEMMMGYIKMLAKQLLTLGYQPTFEFIKIQNVYLPYLTAEYKNENHAKHGIYLLTQKLIDLGGFENEDIEYNKIKESRGVRITFNNDSLRLRKCS
jgi:hypothetical protein